MGFGDGLEWSDLNPFTWPGQVKSSAAKDFGFMGAESESAKRQREMLEQQGAAASGFAGVGEGNYGAMTEESKQARDYLRRLATGEESVSREQLRQGLLQNTAAQRSYAASASPSNQPAAARTAAIQMGKMGSGLSGQQAMAGIAERQAAQKAWNDAILGARGQDLQAALGSRQNAVNAYGGGKPEGTWMDKYGGAVSAGIGALAMMSDKRLKTEIKDGDDDANAALKGLRAFAYKYRDEKHGKGKQVGIMAQDLERAGLKHTVVETPIGKAVDGGKLAGANTAMLAALAKRVAKIEGKGK